MVLEALGLAGVAGGVKELFSYNRENFFFDREMRQKQEFQILAFRNKQAELWREDVRDIIGMTEKKMDSYLVIATLQLGMCVGLFCEGRLEPGTPPWLLSFYVLALSGAFLYLLMSVWFAMHASVVANCSSVRLLTQFVRLPVPTWDHLEDLRTYASSYESLELQHMLRVPFTGSRGFVKGCEAEEQQGAGAAGGQEPAPGRAGESAYAPSAASSRVATPSMASTAGSGRPAPAAVADPWGLERHGERRDLYELQDKHPALRAHVGLARKACQQFQCFDAYARVAMTFGTNQLLNGIAYYSLGYCTVQDGAILPAWSVITIMCCIMVTLLNIDVALSARERAVAMALQLTGPILGAVATTGWALQRERFEDALMYILPVAYSSHGLWLLWILGAIGMQKQPNGSVLPVKFRAVLYLDVFGWLNGEDLTERSNDAYQSDAVNDLNEAAEAAERHEISADAIDLQCKELLEVQKELRSDIVRWKTERLQKGMCEGRFGPATLAFGDGSGQPAGEAVRDGSFAAEAGFETVRPPASGGSGGHQEVQRNTSTNLLSQSLETASEALGLADEDGPEVGAPGGDGLGSEVPREPAAPSPDGPPATHSVRVAPEHAFHPASYVPPGFGTRAVAECDESEVLVAGQEGLHPGRLPAKVFRLSTVLLAVLWIMGLAYPCRSVRELMLRPSLGKVVVQEERPIDTMTGQDWESVEVPGVMGTDPNGLPMFIPLPQAEPPELEHGELIDVEWPVHAGFFPRALSCDASGLRLVVADDVGLYTAELRAAAPAVPSPAGGAAGAGRRLRAAGGAAAGGAGGAAGGGAGAPRPVARFTRVARCPATEGQALRDMSVACSGAGPDARCRVLVLIAKGPTLAECPLPRGTAAATASAAAAAGAPGGGGGGGGGGPTHSDRAAGRRGNHTWTIAKDWLHREPRGERVDALAVNSDCLDVGGDVARHPGTCAFRAEDVGCVVVGTSLGRILQLRGNLQEDSRELVPERSVHWRADPISHGALHVLPSGAIVALDRRRAVSGGSGSKERMVEAAAQAFDGKEGYLIGQWRLPRGVDWLTLSGAGDSLLALGLRDRQLQLYRFPVPRNLTARARREEASDLPMES